MQLSLPLILFCYYYFVVLHNYIWIIALFILCVIHLFVSIFQKLLLKSKSIFYICMSLFGEHYFKWKLHLYCLENLIFFVYFTSSSLFWLLHPALFLINTIYMLTWAWMKDHHLQLNMAKTELLVFPAIPTLQHDFSIQLG